MKEYLHSRFQGFIYEKVFGPDELPSIEVRKRIIVSYDIVSVLSRGKERDIW